jgi:hypothetical protein
MQNIVKIEVEESCVYYFRLGIKWSI